LQRDHTHHPLSVAHEAWRYGIVIQPADEEELVRWLQKMVEWIQGEI
jgi:CRISPR/Cas system-associated exonuclease Cas4 (RecB family)